MYTLSRRVQEAYQKLGNYAITIPELGQPGNPFLLVKAPRKSRFPQTPNLRELLRISVNDLLILRKNQLLVAITDGETKEIIRGLVKTEKFSHFYRLIKVPPEEITTGKEVARTSKKPIGQVEASREILLGALSFIKNPKARQVISDVLQLLKGLSDSPELTPLALSTLRGYLRTLSKVKTSSQKSQIALRAAIQAIQELIPTNQSL